jgi:hypothetical protein
MVGDNTHRVEVATAEVHSWKVWVTTLWIDDNRLPPS